MSRSQGEGLLLGLVRGLLGLLTSRGTTPDQRADAPRGAATTPRLRTDVPRSAPATRLPGAATAGNAKETPRAAESTRRAADDTTTTEVDPPGPDGLTIVYAPERDGEPDAGEVVWTWVPYAENDGRGKDRPVLVIARQSAHRVYAVKLTSKDHDGRRDFLPIGPGAWDPQGRPSWVDIDQLYSVHADGMRREAAALDLKRFAVVAQELRRRFGWRIGD
ncbi:type II toxin-antitoxin system PemK/MazF family toxin [Microbacterium sp. No. 7]|uniref:type II toxin-antitoxin system PemK/MazF family toxin n=1 Tax=Microbacterium sp. No. 7 TaxID=1714373 RepID=UPI0006D0FAA5|nr:type II toxin-antitoxin system PemK/MazF family toxin [Microbacterium sp. No. 7]ALJ20421.1 hypothetical protein AOA12_11100 [Microbacterium sp. No. 7]